VAFVHCFLVEIVDIDYPGHARLCENGRPPRDWDPIQRFVQNDERTICVRSELNGYDVKTSSSFLLVDDDVVDCHSDADRDAAVDDDVDYGCDTGHNTLLKQWCYTVLPDHLYYVEQHQHSHPCCSCGGDGLSLPYYYY